MKTFSLQELRDWFHLLPDNHKLAFDKYFTNQGSYIIKQFFNSKGVQASKFSINKAFDENSKVVAEIGLNKQEGAIVESWVFKILIFCPKKTTKHEIVKVIPNIFEK